MNRKLTTALVATAMMVAAQGALASSLIYEPVNPKFGGDPLNGNWLLSQSQSQTDNAGGGPSSFSIDFPDFGGIPQTDDGDDTDLPPV